MRKAADADLGLAVSGDHSAGKLARAVPAADEGTFRNDDQLLFEIDMMSRNSSLIQGSSVSSQGALTSRTQCLRFETITDRESRFATFAIRMVALLGDMGAIALVIVKQSKAAEGLLVMNGSFVVMQVAINAVLLTTLLAAFSVWGVRVASSYHHGMKWTRRRKGVARLTALRGALVVTIVASHLAINARLLASPSAFCSSRRALPLLDALTWMCWNVMLLTYVLEAHGTNLLRRGSARDGAADGTGSGASVGTGDGASEGKGKGKGEGVSGEEVSGDGASEGASTCGHPARVVWDLPLWTHWPKLFIWAPFAVLVAVAACLSMDARHMRREPIADGGDCTWGARLLCTVSPALGITTMLTYVAVGVYFILYVAYLWRAWSHLQEAQYQKYRTANLVLRVQFQFNGAMMTALFVGMTFTICIGGDDCINFSTTWLGSPPVSFILTCLQLVSLYFSFPRRHDFLETRRTLPPLLLQQFAWTEADVPRRRAARHAALHAAPAADPPPGDQSDRSLEPRLDLSATSPLFCFETAIKLFFWSVLVYSYQEAAGPQAGASLEAMPAPIRELLGEMDAAMRLFSLTNRRLFYDEEHGTKALAAWSDTVILLTFRGTAVTANIIQDAKFFQTAHPPQRKFRRRVPRVHQGFLDTWHAPAMHDAVMALVRDRLAAAPQRDAVRVLCTGHSLGGAVAQLASFDIVRELSVDPTRISVYTFGCPRIGNHALAAEFDEVVPDTWHLINDQDIVTRGMKMWGMYKRAGQRVTITRHGDLIVRPAHFEISLLQTRLLRASNAAHHATVAYQRALLSIVTAQLRDSSRHADGLHGLLGLLKQLPQVRQALESHAQQLGTRFPDLLRSIANALPVAAPTPDDGPAFFNASRRFTRSRHASLLRAAGELPEIGVAAVGGEAAPPRSDAATSDDEEAIVPVAEAAPASDPVSRDAGDCRGEGVVPPADAEVVLEVRLPEPPKEVASRALGDPAQ